MKDQTDTQTTELFPVAEPKRRGRPATGKAKTAAQRQADYRNRKTWRGGTDNCGHHHLDTWIESSAMFALDRLAALDGIKRGEVLKKLLLQADDKIQAALGIGSDDWQRYWDKTLQKHGAE
ncbi:hypothetical protein [Methylomonas fluvii]|uniref:Uncharacterized protein n=1 Tax=Methylomonas fluvii TaxID=1854564 RepID=A0ABR9DHX7_9GAMM|nr:hypothetical protein [Methylomonas fluvii]MBD9362719.1 hypothetical protein [Methylomonas fluvii]CAD6875861.1 hypothetical protein [Methylomonas fluvii]